MHGCPFAYGIKWFLEVGYCVLSAHLPVPTVTPLRFEIDYRRDSEGLVYFVENVMKQQGFVLLALLGVIGIIAILAAIALPQYNESSTKARITEALRHGQAYARELAEGSGRVYADAPAGLEYAAIERVGSDEQARVKIVFKDGIDSEVVFGTDDDTAAGKVMLLTLEGSPDTDRWECRTDMPAPFMPKVCTFDSCVNGCPDGTPWKDVPPGQRGNYTVCWNQEHAYAAGAGNGWVVGGNRVDDVEWLTQDDVRDVASEGIKECCRIAIFGHLEECEG